MTTGARHRVQRVRMLTRVAASVLALGVCASLSTGCDGIGRPLVDRRFKPYVGDGCPRDEIAPPCDGPPDVMLDAGPLPLEHVDFAECMRAPDCRLPDLGRGDAGDAADAGVAAGDAGTDAPCDPLGVDALDHAALECTSLRIELDGSQGAVVAREPNLSNVQLAIEARVPATLTIERATLQRVSIRLHGPVTLRIDDAVMFEDIAIASVDAAGGAARVELTDLESDRLVIGQNEQAFVGTARIERCTLEHTNLRASAIELSSARMNDWAIESRELFTADSTLNAGRLAVGRATFASSQLSRVQVGSCEALVLIASGVTFGELPACSVEPLRAYNSRFSRSTVNGLIDSDEATFDKVRFGLITAVDLVGWNTTMESVAFCGLGRSLHLGGMSNRVLCSTCMDPVMEPACFFPEGKGELRLNACEALSKANVQACAGPVPERPRP